MTCLTHVHRLCQTRAASIMASIVQIMDDMALPELDTHDSARQHCSSLMLLHSSASQQSAGRQHPSAEMLPAIAAAALIKAALEGGPWPA